MSLDADLLAAHACGDRLALIGLYIQAAETASTEAAQGFYLTHAYIFALEAGDLRADALAQQLRDQGRI